MKTKELRSQKMKGLTSMLSKLVVEIGKTRMELGVGKLKNNQKLRQTRRDIARIKTILHEQEIISEENEGKE